MLYEERGVLIPGLTPVILVMNDEYFLPYALKSIMGRFEKYVIYDIGSKDKTRNIIDWFYQEETKQFNSKFVIRKLPFCPPEVQGTFRNSMIAEAGTDWYFILDGDEIYTAEGLCFLKREFLKLQDDHYRLQSMGPPLYGVCKRVEVDYDLKHCFDKQRSHHRVYHRIAIWEGSHPGEVPVIPQKDETEQDLQDVICYHFHNAIRSTFERDVPHRVTRKNKRTYRPGKLINFDLLGEIPILRDKIEDFPVHPELQKLQNAYK